VPAMPMITDSVMPSEFAFSVLAICLVPMCLSCQTPPSTAAAGPSGNSRA
jgi:hypothetical protein